jgi:hypothetical protein
MSLRITAQSKWHALMGMIKRLDVPAAASATHRPQALPDTSHRSGVTPMRRSGGPAAAHKGRIAFFADSPQLISNRA